MKSTCFEPGPRLAVSLASGLTLRRYASFRICPSWAGLGDEAVNPEVSRRGIHLLLVQDARRRLVVGDSHEYGEGDFAPGIDTVTEHLILAEARRLFQVADWTIERRWHGVYSLHPERLPDAAARAAHRAGDPLDRLRLQWALVAEASRALQAAAVDETIEPWQRRNLRSGTANPTVSAAGATVDGQR